MNLLKITTHLSLIPIVLLLFGFLAYGADFQSDWAEDIQQTWVGSEYWANRLQDWQIANGRLECVFSGPDRNVHLLTRHLDERPGAFEMSVELGRLDQNANHEGKGWAGFKIGAQGEFNDYRDSAVRGKGLHAGITANGRLFIGDVESANSGLQHPLDFLKLHVRAAPHKKGYTVTLSVYDGNGKKLGNISRPEMAPHRLVGNLTIVCHGEGKKHRPRFWFRNWKIAGSKVSAHDSRLFGPVLFAQYTLSRGILKLTAQMAPVGEASRDITLQIQSSKMKFTTVAQAPIDRPSFTATFRVAGWDSTRDFPYRILCRLPAASGAFEETFFEGIIRREPLEKESIVFAAFTGNNDLGFPNTDLVSHVQAHDPDLLFFSGDQIYEGVGGYDVQRFPIDKACLDYLRKWYIFGWCYRDLMRSRPTICIPDDHDVFHGNIWGCAGKATIEKGSGADKQDSGGFKMPPHWVNMVQRTQTSHLPDPFDPSPVNQGIGVYYCELNYGGISFAILEDRKFKSAPKPLLPEAKIWNGWPQNEEFDPKKNADVAGAVLLGKGQLAFLDKWAEDWSNQTWMKVVLSQTLFSNVATLPEDAKSGAVIPRLRVLPSGMYAENDHPVADFDSNSWPQTPRNNALRAIRKAFALHIAGDQHLGSTIHYGIDDWHDAGFAFCVPAVSNIWPRRWFPSTPGKNRKPGAPKYTGDFRDGFGNRMTVHAVSNPVFTGRKPAALYDRAAGFGIVRLHRESRNITFECWPRAPYPGNVSLAQFPGWPITINQLDNYSRKPASYLPILKFTDTTDPVLQIVDEKENEILYTLRIRGDSFRPMVFRKGLYTIRAGQPDEGKVRTLRGVQSLPQKERATIEMSIF